MKSEGLVLAFHIHKLLFVLTIKVLLKLPPGKPIKVVLLGKTGNGKSATGNTLLGREVFEENHDAESKWTNCRIEKREDDEREITVIDTPGFMHTGSSTSQDHEENQEKVLQEATRMFSQAPDGFDAIALVMKIGTRFTKEDQQTLTLIQKWLGKDAEKNMFLILTCADQARQRAEKQKASLDEIKNKFIKSSPRLQEFVKQIGENKVLLFDNTLEINTDASKEQVSRFIQV